MGLWYKTDACQSVLRLEIRLNVFFITGSILQYFIMFKISWWSLSTWGFWSLVINKWIVIYCFIQFQLTLYISVLLKLFPYKSILNMVFAVLKSMLDCYTSNRSTDIEASIHVLNSEIFKLYSCSKLSLTPKQLNDRNCLQV